MNCKRLTVGILALALAVAVLVTMRGRRLASNSEFIQASNQVAAAPPTTAPAVSGRRTNAVVETGEARMSNAVCCMAHIIALADKMPAEQRRHFMAVAGVLFFDDCLMSKMTNGYIRTTTNELRAAFTNALAQVFSNQIPDDVKNALDKAVPDGEHWQASPPLIYEHEKYLSEHPYAALVDGFTEAMTDRNNFGHVSLDDQYNDMAKQQQLAISLNQINVAIQKAGIADPPQSDLKELCIALGESRTSAYLFYGPSSSSSLRTHMERGKMPDDVIERAVEKQKAFDAAQFQSYAGPMDDILAWRLSNMYQLDNATSQALVQAMAVVPVTGFSGAGAQPPAWIE